MFEKNPYTTIWFPYTKVWFPYTKVCFPYTTYFAIVLNIVYNIVSTNVSSVGTILWDNPLISGHYLICLLFAQLFFRWQKQRFCREFFTSSRECGSSVWFFFSAWPAQMAEPESSSSGGKSGSGEQEERPTQKGRARPASVVSSAFGLVVSHDHRKPRSCLLVQLDL